MKDLEVNPIYNEVCKDLEFQPRHTRIKVDVPTLNIKPCFYYRAPPPRYFSRIRARDII